MSWIRAGDRRLFQPVERLFYPYCRKCKTVYKPNWFRGKLGGGPFRRGNCCGEELEVPPDSGWQNLWRMPLFLIYLLLRLAYWWVCFLLLAAAFVFLLIAGLLIVQPIRALRRVVRRGQSTTTDATGSRPADGSSH